MSLCTLNVSLQIFTSTLRGKVNVRLLCVCGSDKCAISKCFLNVFSFIVCTYYYKAGV